MRKIKVVFFAHESALKGGSNRSLLELVDRLRTIMDIVVITPAYGGLNAALHEIGIQNRSFRYNQSYYSINNSQWIVWLKRLRYLLTTHIAEFMICRYLKNLNVDIIHSNSSTIDIGARVARSLRKVHIWHIREYGEEDHACTYMKPIEQRVEYMEKNSSIVAFISSDLLQKYRAYFKTEKHYRIVRNGVDQKAFYFRRDKAEFFGATVKIVCCGAVKEGKNQIQLLRALYILVHQKHITNLCVYFLGQEEKCYAAELNQYVNEKKLGAYVSFCGHVEHTGAFIRTCHIAVMPSKREAFGRVTVEYMLAGIGVIASNTGANMEIIDANVGGLIYRLEDDKDLSEKIERFIHDRDFLYQCALRGQEKALQEFTSHSCARRVFTLYEEALSQSAEGR